jgi:HNH endonuclease
MAKMANGWTRMTVYQWLAKTISEHNSDECLIWPFRVDRDGYGRLRPPQEEYGRITFAAHRLAFKLKYGRWPEPLGTHSCDTPRCINPRHVKEGTHAINQAEKAARGRSIRGAKQHSAKLSDAKARFIRKSYDRRHWGDVRKLSERFGVSRVVIRLIGQRKLWRHA